MAKCWTACTETPDRSAWHLPWTASDVPHGLLDILRGCNLRCPACYNHAPARRKTLAEIEDDLRTLERFRKLQSVAIVGGEPLLHPELCDAVRMVKRHGLAAELFTNAVLFDESMAARLGTAGLDLICFHIEAVQQRPDLPDDGPKDDALRRLREEHCARAARHGMEAGLAMTVYPDRLDDVATAADFVLGSPHCNYLVATLRRDHTGYDGIAGDLASGMRTSSPRPMAPEPDTLDNVRMARFIRERFGFAPFARLGSNLDPDDTRWLSYLVATALGPDGRADRLALRAGPAERAFMALSRRRDGRHTLYRPQRPRLLAKQVRLNAALGGGILRATRLLRGWRRHGGPLLSKRLLFQNPAEIGRDGRVVHCLHCPDAVAKDGRLVPACLADFTTVVEPTRETTQACRAQAARPDTRKEPP
jgi:hypothetical protein